jgi:membrane protein
MARVTDVPKVIKHTGLVGFGKKVWKEINDDEVLTWGSALAYAWIFAIFPFLIFVLTLAPYLPGDTKGQIMGQVSGAVSGMGDSAKPVIQSVNEVIHNQKGGLMSLGIVLALWGASGGMSMTMSALDKAYYVHCTRGFVKQRLIAIGLTIAAAVLILSVMFLLPIGTGIIEYLAKQGHLGFVGKLLVNVLRYAIAIGLLFLIVALIYYFGPCVKAKWQAVTPGAIFTVAVWIVLGFGFAFYVKHFGNFNATYGILGGAIVLLLFFYINAVVLVIGAEVNSVIDFETLDVERGATDLTQAKAKAEYDQAHAGDDTGAGSAEGAASARPGAKARPPLAPVKPAPASGGTGKKVLIAGSALVGLKYAWGRYSAARAKTKAVEQARDKALDEARKRWLRWAAS